MAETRLKDAVFSYVKKQRFAAFVFCSRDWKTLKPWAYDKKQIPYFYSKHVLERDIGRMTTVFFGPLCVVYYKMKAKTD